MLMSTNGNNEISYRIQTENLNLLALFDNVLEYILENLDSLSKIYQSACPLDWAGQRNMAVNKGSGQAPKKPVPTLVSRTLKIFEDSSHNQIELSYRNSGRMKRITNGDSVIPET